MGRNGASCHQNADRTRTEHARQDRNCMEQVKGRSRLTHGAAADNTGRRDQGADGEFASSDSGRHRNESPSPRPPSTERDRPSSGQVSNTNGRPSGFSGGSCSVILLLPSAGHADFPWSWPSWSLSRTSKADRSPTRHRPRRKRTLITRERSPMRCRTDGARRGDECTMREEASSCVCSGEGRTRLRPEGWLVTEASSVGTGTELRTEL